MRPGRGVAEWHMLPSWNSLHTLLVARAVLLWHGASYPMLRCSSLARHPDLGPPTVPCARRPLFWYPIPVRIGSPTGDAWLTCQCASQSACSAFHNIRRLSLPSLAGEGTSHCAICWLRSGASPTLDTAQSSHTHTHTPYQPVCLLEYVLPHPHPHTSSAS